MRAVNVAHLFRGEVFIPESWNLRQLFLLGRHNHPACAFA
jgi:hypothetical protein